MELYTGDAVGITLDQSERSSVIRLEGSIDIAVAAELKKLLLQASKTGNEIEVSLEDATGLDVTAVQLIWAARRAAEGAGSAFALSGAVSESVSSALRFAGLQEFLELSDDR